MLIHWKLFLPSLNNFNSNWSISSLTIRSSLTKLFHIAFKIAKSPDTPLIKKERSVLILWVGTFKGWSTCLFNGIVEFEIEWAVATTNWFISNISIADKTGFLQCATLQVKQLNPLSNDRLLSKYSHGALDWNSELGAINFMLCSTSFIWDAIFPCLLTLLITNT